MTPNNGVILPVDIWFMVFEELGIADNHDDNGETLAEGVYARWVRETRLVCEDFYNIVTPWVYEYSWMKSETKLSRMVDSSEPSCAQYKANVIKYSAWLAVSTSANLESLALTAYIVERCKKLEYLHWDNNIEDKVKDVEFSVSTIACSYLNGPSSTQHWSFDTCKEYGQVEDVSRTRLSKTSRVLELPEGSLGKDAQLSVYRTSYEEAYDPFADAKPKSTALQTLILSYGSSGGLKGLVPSGKKIPPMKKLKLSAYEWVTSAEEFPLMWDFSSLYSLSMTLEFAGFMSRVPIAALSQLRTFSLSAQFFDSYDNDDNITPAAAQKYLSSLIDSCKDLESLKIESDYWQALLPMSSIAKAGNRLRKLRLTGNRELIPIPRNVLREGLDYCLNLVDLGLDLDVVNSNMYDYLGILAQKESLRDINLYTQDTLRIECVNEHSTDPDCDGASTIMQFLHTQKPGTPFNMVRIRLSSAKQPPNWRPNLEKIGDYQGHWCDRRDFMSRINITGTYEQWGSERIGNLPEGHIGTSEVGDNNNSEYWETDGESGDEEGREKESGPQDNSKL